MQVFKLSTEPLLDQLGSGNSKKTLRRGCSVTPRYNDGLSQQFMTYMSDNAERADQGVRQICRLNHKVNEIKMGFHSGTEQKKALVMLTFAVTLVTFSILTIGASPGGFAAAAAFSRVCPLITQSLTMASWSVGQAGSYFMNSIPMHAYQKKAESYHEELLALRKLQGRLHYALKVIRWHLRYMDERMPVNPSEATIRYEREMRELERQLTTVVGQLQARVADAGKNDPLKSGAAGQNI